MLASFLHSNKGCVLKIVMETVKVFFNEIAAYTHHHPVGTCQMGVDDNSVVSPELNVYGVANLFVSDASIIPNITTGPTNAAVLAIAEKSAYLLLKQSPLSPIHL